MEESFRGAVMMQAAVVVTLFVIALLLEEVAALGVVSLHFLDFRGVTRLERGDKKMIAYTAWRGCIHFLYMDQ